MATMAITPSPGLSNTQTQSQPVQNDAPPTSLTTKADEIFNARVSILDRMRTDRLIRNSIAALLILLGVGAMIGGWFLPATVPLAIYLGFEIGGAFAGWFGAFLISTRRILKGSEEKRFWNALSKDSLSELTRARWGWYCNGSPYYGRVSGVCKITYEELQTHKIMSREAAGKLKNILDRSAAVEFSENREVHSLETLDAQLVVDNARDRITAKYVDHKRALQAEYIEFRDSFIRESHQQFCGIPTSENA